VRGVEAIAHFLKRNELVESIRHDGLVLLSVYLLPESSRRRHTDTEASIGMADTTAPTVRYRPGGGESSTNIAARTRDKLTRLERCFGVNFVRQLKHTVSLRSFYVQDEDDRRPGMIVRPTTRIPETATET